MLVQAPGANAIGERSIGTLRRECLVGTLRRERFDRMLLLGQRQFEAVLAEHVEHCDSHRPQRCLSQLPPAALATTPAPTDHVDAARTRITDRMSALVQEYSMAAWPGRIGNWHPHGES